MHDGPGTNWFLEYSVPEHLRSDAVVVYDDKARLIFGLIGGLICGGVGLVLLWKLPNFDRKAHLVFSGVMLSAGSAWRLLRSKPRLILDGNGITDLWTGLGLIPWPQVVAVRLITHLRRPHLCLTLVDADVIRLKRGKRSWWNSGIDTPEEAGPADVAILVWGLQLPPGRVLELVEHHRRANMEPRKLSKVAPIGDGGTRAAGV